MGARFADVVAAGREEAAAAAQARLAFCEWCGQPVPGPLADCDDAVCRALARELLAPFPRRAA